MIGKCNNCDREYYLQYHMGTFTDLIRAPSFFPFFLKLHILYLLPVSFWFYHIGFVLPLPSSHVLLQCDAGIFFVTFLQFFYAVSL